MPLPCVNGAASSATARRTSSSATPAVSLATLRAIESGAKRGWRSTTLADLNRTLAWEPGTAEGLWNSGETARWGVTRWDEGHWTSPEELGPDRVFSTDDQMYRYLIKLVREVTEERNATVHGLRTGRLGRLVNAGAEDLDDEDLDLVVALVERLRGPVVVDE